MPPGVTTAVMIHPQYGFTTWLMPAPNKPAMTLDSGSSPETALAIVMPVVTPASFPYVIVHDMLLLLRFSSFIP